MLFSVTKIAGGFASGINSCLLPKISRLAKKFFLNPLKKSTKMAYFVSRRDDCAVNSHKHESPHCPNLLMALPVIQSHMFFLYVSLCMA
jgi:hypothetical protein